MKISKLSAILIILILLFGCTHMQVQPLHTIGDYQTPSKYDLKTELYLTEELRNAKYERSAAGDTWIIPLGENLTHNSEVLVRSLFSDVSVTNGEVGQQHKEVDIIITPRLVSVDQSVGVWKWSDNTLTISLEWSINDVNGNSLWIDTVKGNGKNEGGNVFTHTTRTEERVKMALEDLFKRSYEAFSSSKIIKDINFKRDKGTRGKK